MWDEGKEIFLSTLSDQIGNVSWEKSLLLSTIITFDTLKSLTEARGVSYTENRFQKSARARSKHRGNGGAALVSIKPCLLMFLLAEARFGNTDHNTIFIPYKIHCEVMRNGNCWAAPGRSFRKECAFPWEFFTARRAILFSLWKKK